MDYAITLLVIVGVLWVCYFLGLMMKKNADGKHVSTKTAIQQTTYQLVMVVVTNAVIATNEEFVKLYKGTEEWTDEKLYQKYKEQKKCCPILGSLQKHRKQKLMLKKLNLNNIKSILNL